MKPFAIKPDIFWVGTVDFNARDFHGYSRSPQGTTYNAYLVRDEKNTLFDTVKAEHVDTMLDRIREVMDPCDINYIVVSHVELDHSAALPEIVRACQPEKIFCSPMGLKSMQGHFDTEGWPIQVVKTGDTISLGKRTIQFVEARMLHWPDSMFSYLPEDKLLISNDAFGQNIASSERFAESMDTDVLGHAMKEYYHNIVQPFAPQVQKTLAQIGELKLDIDMIAPDHGLIFRGANEVSFALSQYDAFAKSPWKKRAVIIFDTMWHSTEKMAEVIGEGLLEAGVEYRVMAMKSNHHSAVMTELADCGLLVAGSPTHNNGIMPAMADVLTYMKGLKPKNKMGAAFGSYGWSGEAPKVVHDWLLDIGMECPLDPVKCQFVPKKDSLEACRDYGRQLGELLTKRCCEAGA